jgi:alkylation response protein AidB-like acyl-CoA dehydrogenase
VTKLSKDDAEALAATVRAACSRMADEEQVRKIAFGGAGFDRELWSVLCQQIGVASVGLPEAYGGAGYGASALGVVAHELGRTLAPVPFLATAVLAVGLLADLGQADRVANLVEGQVTATVAGTGSYTEFTASLHGGQWVLNGSARHVLHGGHCDELLVIANADEGRAVFLVDRDESGVLVEAENVLDATRPMATVELKGAVALQLGTNTDPDAAIDRNLLRTLAVLSAEQVGAHERVLEMATEYARDRVQFGRPIGGFQAVKHKCADVLTALELSRSASLAALHAVDDDSTDAFWLTSMAKAVCSEGLRDAAHANLQIHGGIGFTWENAAHLYLKRARTDEVLFGGPGTHWDRVALATGIFGTSPVVSAGGT